MDIKKIFTSTWGVGLLLCLAVFLGVLKFQQNQSQKAIEREKQSLLEQAQELEQNNKDLSDSLELISSQAYREKIARQQLNVKREGEVVYTFSENPSLVAMVQPTEAETTGSNASQWWNYFFGP